jgi:hypothetical protein
VTEPELISDSIKYFQCEPIEGDWRSYYISQVCQTHCVYEAFGSCIRVAVEALPFHCVSSWQTMNRSRVALHMHFISVVARHVKHNIVIWIGLSEDEQEDRLLAKGKNLLQ